ncbi:PASTA domain-containing protein [Actinoplanes sp. NPDC051861]|uniref:PASTA domain-containing protein n=1 Tax=Actinoplanes sp. NPDC051861 TaxID=3155170 RepID=UPI00343DF880
MSMSIGGYDVVDSRDQIFSFDYDHSGKMDHLVLYRPGTGLFSIMRNIGGLHQFAAVYQSTSGIGGYEFNDNRDRAFAFDYEHTGKLDHLVVYRPGTATISVLRNKNGMFAPVFQSNGGGIGGYDLRDNRDQAFAFDYDRSGKQDHIVIYRPGTGAIYILKNVNGKFTAVYAQGAPGGGIGTYDLRDDRDRVVPFDFLHSGRLDHLLLYRPGVSTIHILKNDNGTFYPVYQGGGIGTYDLADKRDRVYTFDYDRTGKPDHLLIVRAGTTTLWIIKHDGDRFTPVFQAGGATAAIGGHPIGPDGDQFADFDFEHSGKRDHLVAYRMTASQTWVGKAGDTPPPPPPAPCTHVIGRSGSDFVTVYVSRQLTRVPYLIGYDDMSGANLTLRTANLEPGKGFTIAQPGSRITGQLPAPGTVVPAGTTVDITVTL